MLWLCFSLLLYAIAAHILSTFPGSLPSDVRLADVTAALNQQRDAARVVTRLHGVGVLFPDRPDPAYLEGLSVLAAAVDRIDGEVGEALRRWEGGDFYAALRLLAERPPPTDAIESIIRDLTAARVLLTGHRGREAIGARQGIDQALWRTQQAVQLAPYLPALLGVGGERRYLVLIQDEGRPQPSGGTITHAWIATMAEGRLTALDPFPLTPQVAAEAAQFPDMPTIARLVRERAGPLAAPDSVAGIVLLNQAALQRLATVARLARPTTIHPPSALLTCAPACDAALTTLLADLSALPPGAALTLLADLLDERHALIAASAPDVQALLMQWQWDGGQFVPRTGDYLMVTTSAASAAAVADGTAVASGAGGADGAVRCESPLTVEYRVDLRRARAAVAVAQAACPLNRVRVYGQFGFFDATLADGSWLESFDEPAEYGGFGVAWPCQGTCQEASFALAGAALPLTAPDGASRYTLTLQRPPGSLAPRLKIAVHLPDGARPLQIPPGATAVDGVVMLSVELRTDALVSITFR